MRVVSIALVALGMASSLACSSSDAGPSASAGATGVVTGGSGAAGANGGASNPAGGATGPSGGAASTAGAGGAAPNGGSAGMPSSDGWLHTMGNGVYVKKGGVDTRWVGRGVNLDDVFFCGYNYTLWMDKPEETLKTEFAGLLSGWKPSFVRLSLSMNSFPTKTSWLQEPAKYRDPMIGVVHALTASPGTYVLVTVRSEQSMINGDPGNLEATGMPSDATTSPNKQMYPTGTDAVYVALVDSFANDAQVLFGLTNEAGGNAASEALISSSLSHAVTTIRTEEDRLGVPHHLVSVQGKGYSGDISFWSQQPLPQDNVVYEVHGYPPPTNAYTYANIPVIIGEYGSLDAAAATAFFQDIESKQIPNLAWDFDPFSNCAPDLLEITKSEKMLTPSDWGKLVQPYLLAHAQ